jgi:hypothetical protein
MTPDPFCHEAAMIWGGGSNTSGIDLERSSSVSTFHFKTPPMCGDRSA